MMKNAERIIVNVNQIGKRTIQAEDISYVMVAINNVININAIWMNAKMCMCIHMYALLRSYMHAYTRARIYKHIYALHSI